MYKSKVFKLLLTSSGIQWSPAGFGSLLAGDRFAILSPNCEISVFRAESNASHGEIQVDPAPYTTTVYEHALEEFCFDRTKFSAVDRPSVDDLKADLKRLMVYYSSLEESELIGPVLIALESS